MPHAPSHTLDARVKCIKWSGSHTPASPDPHDAPSPCLTHLVLSPTPPRPCPLPRHPAQGEYYEAVCKDIDPVNKELVCCFPADVGFDEACFKLSYDVLIISVRGLAGRQCLHGLFGFGPRCLSRDLLRPAHLWRPSACTCLCTAVCVPLSVYGRLHASACTCLCTAVSVQLVGRCVHVLGEGAPVLQHIALCSSGGFAVLLLCYCLSWILMSSVTASVHSPQP